MNIKEPGGKLVKRTVLSITALTAVIAALLVADNLNNLDRLAEAFSSVESFKEMVNGFGINAYLTYWVIQYIQVIISPVPGNITGLAGGALFGLTWGFILSTTAIAAGSTTAFLLARLYGRPLVEKLAGRKMYEKYKDALSHKSVYVLFVAFLMPFFPDDILCLIAGLSLVSFPVFLLLLLARVPGILVSTLAGAGIVSLSVWQWAVVALVSLIMLFLFFKYRKKLPF